MQQLSAKKKTWSFFASHCGLQKNVQKLQKSATVTAVQQQATTNDMALQLSSDQNPGIEGIILPSYMGIDGIVISLL